MSDDRTGTGIGTEILNLGQDFPPVSTATWEAAIQKDLKGADYEKRLVWRSDEGLAVRPYYRSENLAGLDTQTASLPGQFPFVRGTGQGVGDRSECDAQGRCSPRRSAARSRGRCDPAAWHRSCGGCRKTRPPVR